MCFERLLFLTALLKLLNIGVISSIKIYKLIFSLILSLFCENYERYVLNTYNCFKKNYLYIGLRSRHPSSLYHKRYLFRMSNKIIRGRLQTRSYIIYDTRLYFTPISHLYKAIC
jgi:hypothetical protein